MSVRARERPGAVKGIVVSATGATVCSGRAVYDRRIAELS